MPATRSKTAGSAKRHVRPDHPSRPRAATIRHAQAVLRTSLIEKYTFVPPAGSNGKPGSAAQDRKGFARPRDKTIPTIVTRPFTRSHAALTSDAALVRPDYRDPSSDAEYEAAPVTRSKKRLIFEDVAVPTSAAVSGGSRVRPAKRRKTQRTPTPEVPSSPLSSVPPSSPANRATSEAASDNLQAGELQEAELALGTDGDEPSLVRRNKTPPADEHLVRRVEGTLEEGEIVQTLQLCKPTGVGGACGPPEDAPVKAADDDPCAGTLYRDDPVGPADSSAPGLKTPAVDDHSQESSTHLVDRNPFEDLASRKSAVPRPLPTIKHQKRSHAAIRSIFAPLLTDSAPQETEIPHVEPRQLGTQPLSRCANGTKVDGLLSVTFITADDLTSQPSAPTLSRSACVRPVSQNAPISRGGAASSSEAVKGTGTQKSYRKRPLSPPARPPTRRALTTLSANTCASSSGDAAQSGIPLHVASQNLRESGAASITGAADHTGERTAKVRFSKQVAVRALSPERAPSYDTYSDLAHIANKDIEWRKALTVDLERQKRVEGHKEPGKWTEADWDVVELLATMQAARRRISCPVCPRPNVDAR